MARILLNAPVPTMLRFALFLALGLSCLACGGNDCRAGAHECSGNIARNCVLDGDEYVMRDSSCAGRCVNGENAAFCAVSDASLDAQCAGVDEPTLRCGKNATLLSCSHGYAVNEYACSSSDGCVEEQGTATCEPAPSPEQEPEQTEPEPESEPELPPCDTCQGLTYYQCGDSGERWEIDCSDTGYCVESAEGAFCAEGGEPDERCTTPDGSFCADGINGYCNQGYVTYSVDCGAPELCIQTDTTNFCALAAEPDTFCTTRSDGESPDTFCEEQTMVQCFAGYRVSEVPCEVGTTCVEYPDFFAAGCQ